MINPISFSRRFLSRIGTYFFRDNTIFTAAAGLGFCSSLAVTNKVSNVIVMNIGVFFVALLSCFAIWAVRPLIPIIGRHHRLAIFMFVISPLVTIFSLIAQVLVPEIALDIKAYIGLIITNCIILGLVEPFGTTRISFREYQWAIYKKVCGYSIALLFMGIFRETLGFGTILGYQVLPANFPRATLFITPIGGFFALAFWRMLISPIAINRGVTPCHAAVESQEPENNFDFMKKKTFIKILLGIGFSILILMGLQSASLVTIPYHIIITTMFLDGIVLSKLLGICPLLGQSKSVSSAAKMGAAVIFVMTFANGLNWIIYNHLLIPANRYIQGALPFFRFEELFDLTIFIFVIAVFVQMVEKIIARVSPELQKSMGIFLPLITVNCVVLGSALFRIPVSSTLLESIMYGFGDGLHWAIVCVLLSLITTQTLHIPLKAWNRDTLMILALGIIASIWSIFGQIG